VQTERIAEAMTQAERRDPMQLEDARRGTLASQTGVRPEHVERLIQHFSRVRDTARIYQRMSFWKRMLLLMRDDPVINRLRLRTWLELRFLVFWSAHKRGKFSRPSGVHPLSDAEVDEPLPGR
jgi:hypothetical protein